MKRLLLLCLYSIALMTTFPVLAEAPDLGPPVGTLAKIGDASEDTATIYKTQQVWEDLHPGQNPTWEDPKLSIVEGGAKVKVVKRATLDNAAWFLIQVKILTGRHEGESWWIHTKVLTAITKPSSIKKGSPPTKSTVKRKP